MSPRLRTLLSAAAFLAGTSCAVRQADDEGDEVFRLPACMAAGGTLGYWADGTQTTVLDWEDGGTAVTACLCITPDEMRDESRHEEIAALLVEECERLAVHYEFEHDDCRHDYEAGNWLGNTGFAISDDWDWTNKHGLDCDDQDEGCAISRPSPVTTPVLISLAGLYWWRRRSRPR